MQELIKITQEQVGNEDRKTVNARDLHEFLESKQIFANWIRSRIIDYGFQKGSDFIVLNRNEKNLSGGRPKDEYYLTLDTGKELAMLEKNEKGRQARKYFIECEKRANQQPALPNSYKEALLALAQEVGEKEELQAKIEADKPKVDFAMDFKATENSVDVETFSKRLGAGRNTVFKWMRAKGYLTKKNMPIQTCIDSKLLEIDTRTYQDKHKVKQSYSVVMVTAKGQTYFWKKYTT